ncbi:MAG: hypothetical protein R3C11_28820 [Planctomycetaceae bacterium]
MYGSDFHVSHTPWAESGGDRPFLWLGEATPVWKRKTPDYRTGAGGLEHLRSLKWAAWAAGLSDTQVEDIFYRNAHRLLGIG